MELSPLVTEEAVRRALMEDLGHGHDITSAVLIPEDLETCAVMRAREKGVLAGIACSIAAFRMVDSTIELEPLKKDGCALSPGDEILKVKGPARPILTAERTALNFITMMSGVATRTSEFVTAVQGTKTKIVCTRKTLPGLRPLQKYAVRMGGGFNHRHGLDDAVLIKDNHIALAGSISAAISKARGNIGHMVSVEIEVDTLEQLKSVLDTLGQYRVDSVLLDNMNPNEMREAVKMIDGRVASQASGNVNIDTIKSVADTGVDIVSIGALTHGLKSLDIGLDMS